MNRVAELPTAFLMARLDLITKELQRMPMVSVGLHSGRRVIRCYEKNRRREYNLSSSRAEQLLGIYERRRELIIMEGQIESIISESSERGAVHYRKGLSQFDRRYWEKLAASAKNSRNNTGYKYKDAVMRSRGEVMIAQVLDSLGLEYVYEPVMVLGNETYRPDFAVWLPEFGRFFFIEFMGMLDNRDYAMKNGIKLGAYMNHGIYINRDILVFTGTENGMITVDEIVYDIKALIDRYCKMYV